MELLITSGLMFAGYNMAKKDESLFISHGNVNNFKNGNDLWTPQDWPDTTERIIADHVPKASLAPQVRNGFVPGQTWQQNNPVSLGGGYRPDDLLPSVSPWQTSTIDNSNFIDDIQQSDEKRLFMQSTHKPGHNNMTPFYAGALKQNVTDRATEPLLDFYTHADDSFKNTRSEIDNMFAPEKNTTNVFGDVSLIRNRDNEENRFIPSLYQQGVTSVESEKIGPGLNLGASDVARPGWQEMVRIMPPTTNEIRTINNPKIEYKGRTLNGKFVTTNRGMQSKVTRERKEPIVENKHGERNFKTTGSYLKAMMPQRIQLNPNNRDEKMEVIGPAFSGAEFRLGRRDAHSQPSRKTNYENNYRGPMHSRVQAQKDCAKDSFYARSTFRQEYESDNPISNVISMVKKAIVGPAQKFRPTRKQNSIHAHRMGHGAHRATQGITRNSDRARDTMRHKLSTDTASHVLGPSTSQTAGAVFDPRCVARRTIKEQTAVEQPAANPQSKVAGVTVYEPTSTARPTLRHETLTDYKHSNVVAVNVGNAVYDPSDRPAVTTRETLLREAPAMNMNAVTRGSAVYDPDDLFRTTIKETNVVQTPLANMAASTTGGIAFDTCDPYNMPRITMKEINTVEAPLTNAAPGQAVNPVYDPQSVFRTTLKQTVVSPNPMTNLSGARKGMAHDPTQVSKTTVRETTLHEAPKSNLAGSRQGQAFDPSIKMRTTVNETTIGEQPISNLTGAVGSAQVYDPEECAKETIRQTTLGPQPVSNISTQGSAAPVYNPSNKARHTVRECTEQDDRGPSNLRSGTSLNSVYNYSEKAKDTIKESTLGEQPLSNAQSAVSLQSVYDPKNVARTTIKQSTMSAQPISNVQTAAPMPTVYDPCDVARHTLKETTLLENYQGQMSAKDLQEGAYKNLKITPRYTSRQDIEAAAQNNYYGTASSNNPKAFSTLMYKNMTTNSMKERIAVGRDPTLSGPKTYVSSGSYGETTTKRVSEQSTSELQAPSLLQEFEYFKMSKKGGGVGLVTGTIPVGNADAVEFLNTMVETKEKNVAENEQGVDTFVLESLRTNPYSISLHEAAAM